MGEVSDELILRFAGLFQGRSICYGRMGVGEAGEKLWAKTVHEEPGEEEFREHLEGDDAGIGVVPLQVNNTCRWGAIDWDHKGADLEALSRQVEDEELPLVVCRSKSGGAHLYVFFAEDVEAPLVQSKLETWANQLNLKNPDGRPVELFPKQTYLPPDEDGNWINLPYYDADDTRRAAYVMGQEMGLEAFLEHAEALRQTETELVASGPFGDGPPCLQRRHAMGIGEGARNTALFNIAVYFKLKYDNWQDWLREYNAQQVDPPLSSSEIDTLVQQHEKQDYAYTAPTEWRCPCSKNGCVDQPYGVTAAKKKAGGIPHGGDFPDVGNLRKVEMDPPRWLVEVDGDDVVLDTQALDSPVYFRRAAMEQTNRHFPRVGHDVWGTIMQELFADLKTVDPGGDVGYRGRFRTLLSEFLATSERTGSELEDLVQSRMPILRDGRVYFRGQDLIEFLHRDRGFRQYQEPDIHMELSRLDGLQKHTVRAIGRTFEVYSLPRQAMDDVNLPDRVSEEVEF